MSFKITTEQMDRLITFSFNISTQEQMISLGRDFRAVMSGQPSSLALIGDPGIGKTSMVSGVLGLNPKKPSDFRCKPHWADCSGALFPPIKNDRFLVTEVEGLGSAVWIDAGWFSVHWDAKDLRTHYRNAYLNRYDSGSKTGVSVVEHADLCSWKPEFEYAVTIHKPFVTSDDRMATFYFEEEVVQSDRVQSFIERNADKLDLNFL